VLGELIAALHLDLVSGELGFPRERQIPFVILPRIAAAVVRARRQRPLRAILSSHVVVHGVSHSKSALRVPRRLPSLHAKLQRGRIDREGWAPAPYGVSAGPAPRMTRTRYIGRSLGSARGPSQTCALRMWMQWPARSAPRAIRDRLRRGTLYHPRRLGSGTGQIGLSYAPPTGMTDRWCRPPALGCSCTMPRTNTT
jgi:hypothetical protein